MSITLEERLQRAAELLDQAAVHPVAVDVRDRSAGRPHPGGATVWARAAAVVLVLGAMAGVAWVSSRGSSDDSASATTTAAPSNSASDTTSAGTDTTAVATETTSAGSTETTAASLGPVETLPTSADLSATPITVQGSSPTSWYRLQPDLDVAWYSDGGNASQLCFRTPVLEQCQVDAFVTGGYVAVQSAGGHWLVVTMDAVTQLTVGLDDGTQQVVPLQGDPQIGWRTGRVVVRTPTDASMTFTAGDVRPTDTTALPASTAAQP